MIKVFNPLLLKSSDILTLRHVMTRIYLCMFQQAVSNAEEELEKQKAKLRACNEVGV